MNPGLWAVAVLGILLVASPAAAGDALDRMLEAVQAATNAPVPGREALGQACGDDMVCSAGLLAGALGGRARLQPVQHPDTDTIRRATTQPSIRMHDDRGTTRVEIVHLGRKLLDELEAALDRNRPKASNSIVVDLRHLRGGRFVRMLEVAGFLVGDRPRAVALVTDGQTEWIDLKAPGSVATVPVGTVMVGRETASAGEVLAALLASFGDARLCGREATAGRATLKAVIPVDHDWRLIVDRAEIVVPGADLRGGLQPSAPCHP